MSFKNIKQKLYIFGKEQQVELPSNLGKLPKKKELAYKERA
jgi:hypothetical protein